MTLETLFYSAATVAVIASLNVVISKHSVHALLYLVLSLLAVAVCFYLMGAPFAAGLEIIVYAGAILVLFVFAVMMFGLSRDETKYSPRVTGIVGWFGPMCLGLVLLALLVAIIWDGDIHQQLTVNLVDAKQVGILLYGPYLLAVELASFLLLVGLVAGYHFAKPETRGGHL